MYHIAPDMELSPLANAYARAPRRCPGQKIAETIYERHQLLSSWLTTLGVDPKVAEEDACRIEHVISPESFEAIKKHVNRH